MKMSRWKEPGTWVSGLGLLVLSGAFFYWLASVEGINKAGYAAAFLAVALFAAMCLRFVPVWMRFWGKGWTEEPREPGRPVSSVPLFFLFLAAAGLTLLALFALRRLLGDTVGFWDHLNFWRALDTNHYLNIAQSGYAYGQAIAFFPGYPLAVRLMNLLIRDPLYAAFLVSALCYAVSGCLLYRLMLLDYSAAGAGRAVKYLLIIPGAFFFAAPMSESLFLMLNLLSLYWARRDKWLLSAIAGGYAAFTRSLGILLLAPLILEAVHACLRDGPDGRGKWARRLVPLLLVPLGTGLYLLLNYRLFGDPFAFMYYEARVWGQSFCPFWQTAAYQTDLSLYVLGTDYYQISLGQWLPNISFCFASLLLMTFTAKKLRPSYSAWFIAYYFFATGTTYLISAPRYLIASVPLYVSLACVTENKKLHRFLSVLFVCAALFYFWAFANSWGVY